MYVHVCITQTSATDCQDQECETKTKLFETKTESNTAIFGLETVVVTKMMVPRPHNRAACHTRS